MTGYRGGPTPRDDLSPKWRRAVVSSFDSRARQVQQCSCGGYLAMPDFVRDFEAGDIMRAHQSTKLHQAWRDVEGL